MPPPRGVLPKVGFTGRLHPKEVPFLNSQYKKGLEKLPF